MVSIIITYVNETGYLKEALQSALEQELDDFEVIVVCNDRNEHAPLHLSLKNEEKVTWMHEPVRGSAFARNFGLHQSNGEWVQFLDVDDMLLPQKIAHQLKYATDGAVVSPHLYKRLDGSVEASKWLPEDIWSGILGSGLGSTSSMLWNKKALTEAGGWSTAYQSHQEYELLFRLFSSGKQIIPVDEKETIVRERSSGSITLGTKQVRAEEGIRLRQAIWNYLMEHSLDTPPRKTAFLQYIFRQLRSLFRRQPEEAKKIFNQYFKKEKFTPEKNGILFYHLLYRFLGFWSTERVYRFYGMVRDKYLPFLPKNN